MVNEILPRRGNGDVNEVEIVICEHEALALRGELATPSGPGPHPAVLVVHNAFGLGTHMRQVIQDLAAEGYVALAVDMYGDGAYSEDESVVGGLVAPLWGNSERLRARMGAWHDVLKARPEVAPDRIAALGYCFGGMCVLEFARGGGDVRAVVSYHGILTTAAPAAKGVVTAHVAVHTGGRDPHVPAADVAALRAELIDAEADWQIAEYAHAYHAFTDPAADDPKNGRAYDALADRLSWASTLALLDLKLRGAEV